MTYKNYSTDINGNTIYCRVDDDGLVRLTCSADDADFKKWIEEGNEPLPAD